MKDNIVLAAIVILAFALLYVVINDMQREDAVLHKLAVPAPAADYTYFPGDKVTITVRGWQGKVDNTTFGQDSIGVDYTDYEDKKQHGWFKATDLQLIDTPRRQAQGQATR